MASAVRAMMGIERVSSASLSCLVASQPSRTGRCMSIRIRSGFSDRALATASPPSTATRTSKPFLARRRLSISRLYSLSSTRRTFGIAHFPHGLHQTEPAASGGTGLVGSLVIGFTVAVLPEHAGQAVAVDRLGQVLGGAQRLAEVAVLRDGQHDHRD